MRTFRKLMNAKGHVSAASSIMAILAGLFVGFVILLVSNAGEAGRGIITILEGGFGGGMKGVGQVLYFATPIIMTGLSVGFAFKTGLFNIGTPGQFIVGAFAAVYVGVKWTFLPAPFHWIVALLCAALAGGLWALIPGLFKAFLNVNEVISTIMMNYIGMYGVNYLVKQLIYDPLTSLSQNVARTAVLPKAGLDGIFTNYSGVNNTPDPSTVNSGILIAIAAAIVMYIVLNKTAFGYELKACGYNRFASRYAGINEKRSIVSSMVIAGMLAGLGGGLLYLSGGNGRRIKVVDVLAAEGFNGIPVSLLGMSNPIGVVFSGLFISFITQGGNYLQRLDYMPEIIDIIIASIIYCSALALIFRRVVLKLFKGRDGLLSKLFPKYAAAGIEDSDLPTIAAAVTEPDLSAGESGAGLLPFEAAPLKSEENEPKAGSEPALPKESAGTGPEESAGTGPEESAGTGPEESAGTGPEESAGTGPEESAGTGPEESAGTGPEESAGAEPEEHAEDEPEESAEDEPEKDPAKNAEKEDE